MSARLTVERLGECLRTLRMFKGFEKIADDWESDRAAILESERDLLAALEHEGHGPADDPGCPDMPDAHAVMVLHPGGRYEWRSCEGCAAVANARKQDAPTGAGGGKT